MLGINVEMKKDTKANSAPRTLDTNQGNNSSQQKEPRKPDSKKNQENRKSRAKMNRPGRDVFLAAKKSAKI
ncbi:unnamed protein product [Caenorhabditis nigoni]